MTDPQEIDSNAPAEPAPEAPAPAKTGVRRRAAAGLALLVLAAVGVGVALWWQAPSRESDARLAEAAFDRRLEGIDTMLRDEAKRIAALESRPAPVTAPDHSAEIDALRAQIDAFGARIRHLEETAAALATLPSPRSADTTELALVLALIPLHDALATARPYARELDAVRALAHDRKEVTEALSPLAPDAGTGIPTTAMLAARFTREVAKDLPAASAATAGEEGQGIGAKILSEIKSLVVIRREGVEDPAEIAEVALDGGELDRAVAALQPMKGVPSLARWLEMAERRLAAEAAWRHLNDVVLARLALGGGSP